MNMTLEIGHDRATSFVGEPNVGIREEWGGLAS